jgi:hypothetical protein
MSDNEGKKDEENKSAEPQKPTGKRPTGLVASSKEDRGHGSVWRNLRGVRGISSLLIDQAPAWRLPLLLVLRFVKAL